MIKKCVGYSVARGHTIPELESQVKIQADHGFIPSGDITVLHVPGESPHGFYQPMARFIDTLEQTTK